MEEYKQALEEEKKTLEDELQSLGINDPINDDWGAILEKANESDRSDANDLADRYEEFGERAYTLGELEIRYREVTDAIERIEKGTYGTCMVCGKEIEPKRLKANPAATTCIEHREEK